MPGGRELAPLPVLVQAARRAVRRHGAGQDAAVHRGGGLLALGARRAPTAAAALARRLPAYTHRSVARDLYEKL